MQGQCAAEYTGLKGEDRHNGEEDNDQEDKEDEEEEDCSDLANLLDSISDQTPAAKIVM